MCETVFEMYALTFIYLFEQRMRNVTDVLLYSCSYPKLSIPTVKISTNTNENKIRIKPKNYNKK